MAAVEHCSALLLAAGLSRRFGEEDKLASLYEGRLLVEHAARTIAALPFAAKMAVVKPGSEQTTDRLRALGFDIVVNDQPELGLSSSIRTGVQALSERGAPILIALGDMPRVPTTHPAALCAAVSRDVPVAASYGLGKPTVPAAFAPSTFGALLDLQGDEGARTLLSGAARVPIEAQFLLDIDIPSDLASQQ